MPTLSEDVSVQETIFSYLDHFDYENAVFLAECYFSFDSSDDALYLLATSYYRSGKSNSAYILLRRYQEVEEVLQDFPAISFAQLKDSDPEFKKSAPFALSLLARIFYKTNRVSKATECWEKSLHLSPFGWTWFERLSKAAKDHSKLDVASIFNPAKIPQRQKTEHQVTKQVPPRISRTPACAQRSETPLTTLAETPVAEEGGCDFDSSTPSPMSVEISSVPVAPNAPPKAPRKAGMKKLVSAMKEDEKSQRVTRRQSSKSSLSVLSQNQTQLSPRRSIRLLHQNSVKENADTRTMKTLLRKPKTKKSLDCDISELNEVNKGRTTPQLILPDAERTQEPAPVTEQKSESAVLLEVLSRFGEAVLSSAKYENEAALAVLEELPEAQRSTPVCAVAIARCHFQAADYKKAVEMFDYCHRSHGHFLDGMELYSTALWQLQQEMELSTLAQDMTEKFKNAPQTWCVVGNCFSLQKEHDSAIKFFYRATQLDPNFAYAYSLLGHEYFSIENYDKATRSFRTAIKMDPMHFNGWYGLGLISYKNEQLPLANVYFRRALEINPKSSVLLCHLSVVQQALMRTDDALKLLNRALDLSDDPLCRYHKAQLLFSKNKLDESLEELEVLKQMVPKEANVFFLLGKVYRKRGDTHKALINFSRATELDPRGEQHNPLIGDRRYDEEPAFVESENSENSMESDDSV